MSSIVSSLTGGVSGNAGGAGANFVAGSANILNPATVDQANQQYNNVNQGLSQQQQFLQALQAQNGLQNQSNVFNQLQGVANGTGPNPAQAQLAQATGANVANQAALMAGQRGASQNVGLIARQAAQQGAATQQNAAGQAASLQANQSLNALNNMGSLATSQANQQANATNAYSTAAQGAQQNILGAIQGQNQANVSNISSQNTANAGVAQEVIKGQNSLIGNVVGGIGSALNLVGQAGSAIGTGVSSAGADIGDVVGTVAGGAGDAVGTVGAGALDVAPAALAAAQGGEIKRYADGGSADAIDNWSNQLQNHTLAQPTANSMVTTQLQPMSGPRSAVGKFFQSFKNNPDQQNSSQDSSSSKQPQGMALAGQTIGKGIGTGINGLARMFTSSPNPSSDDTYNQLTNKYGDISNVQDVTDNPNYAKGGKVPAMVSPGERYLPPKEVEKVAKGKNPMKAGEKIPGKPEVSGAKNSYANDTVPKTLEEGGIVLPRSVTQAKHPHWEAHKFVSAILAKEGRLPPRKAK